MDWYDRAQDKKEEVIDALEEDIEERLRDNYERFDDPEQTGSLKRRRVIDETPYSSTVKVDKVVYRYDYNKDSLEWVMLIENEEDPDEDKKYIDTNYLNQFEEAVEFFISIIDESSDKSKFGFVDAYEEYQDYIQEARMNHDLDDVIEYIRKNDLDKALTILGTCEDYRDYVWKMVKYWENGEMKDNSIEILTDENNRVTVRCKQVYDGNDSVAGFVVGMDDTPDRFFIHRLQNTKKLREASPEEWDDEDIREMMGFEKDLNVKTAEDDLKNIGMRFRAQGDLRIRVLDKREVMDELVKNQLTNQNRDYYDEIEEVSIDFRGEISVDTEDTEETKELQQELEIPEEELRKRQEADGLKSLRNSRRQEYIADILEERLVNENLEEYEEIEKEFTSETGKVPMFVDNHMCIVDGAYTNVPSTGIDGGLFVVPEEAQVLIMHDEHNPKMFTVPAGAYAFDFLDRNVAEELAEMGMI